MIPGQLSISVIICTHNPRPNYINRVLDALKLQSLSFEHWELLLIDNASEQVLALTVDLSWHPNARHIREEHLGLTFARLRGIQESVASTLVFVDDDNVLDVDYLKLASKISEEWPMLGAWGGQCIPEFEEQPPEWTKPYWWLLAIREFDRDRWSNLLDQYSTLPCGAGLCIRISVGQKYAEIIRTQPERSRMDRKGKLLTSGGDGDIGLTSLDMGLGTGVFTTLKLIHLMPKNRLQEDYLLKLREGEKYSAVLLDFLRGKLPTNRPWFIALLRNSRRFLMDSRTRKFYDATERGELLAKKEIARLAGQ